MKFVPDALRNADPLFRLLQSPRQFIRSRLNEPQRKPLIKARENERGRVTYVSEIFNETNRIHGGRRAQAELSRSRNRHDYTRVREEEVEKEAEEGGKGGSEWKNARQDEDALQLAPAGDVRRDFLFGPAQPRGSLLLFQVSLPRFFAFSFLFDPHTGALLSLLPSRRFVYPQHRRARVCIVDSFVHERVSKDTAQRTPRAAVIAHVLIIC